MDDFESSAFLFFAFLCVAFALFAVYFLSSLSIIGNKVKVNDIFKLCS